MPRLLQCLVFCLLALWATTQAAALEPLKVAPGVYAFIGDTGEISPANGGFAGNSGFLVGPTGVVVIDSGASSQQGERMIEAIGRVSRQPIVLVIITHAIEEFLFGNAAFRDRGIALLTHSRSAALMTERCEHCLQNLRLILGERAMAGTRLVIPERLVDGSLSLEAGGRRLELIHLGWASTPGDLGVLDVDSGVLFAGGLASVGRIPPVRDAHLDTWLLALEALRARPFTQWVPGHGPVSPPQRLEDTSRYLRDLDVLVRGLYDGGASLLEAVDRAPLPAYVQWAQYLPLHRQNVLHRYLQLEGDELAR